MPFISSGAQMQRHSDARTLRLKPSGSLSLSKDANLIRALSRPLTTNLSDLSLRSDPLIPQEEETIANVGDSEMARSRIKYFKSRDLALPGDLPGVLIRQMLAVNDIALAADANDVWAELLNIRVPI
jgi:hypothetical protein